MECVLAIQLQMMPCGEASSGSAFMRAVMRIIGAAILFAIQNVKATIRNFYSSQIFRNGVFRLPQGIQVNHDRHARPGRTICHFFL